MSLFFILYSVKLINKLFLFFEEADKMSQIINQTDEYNTVTENELSVILASFETQFIYSVIPRISLINRHLSALLQMSRSLCVSISVNALYTVNISTDGFFSIST